MAKAPFSATILAFIENLVSKTVKRAIEMLLNPCCDMDITDIDFTCTATGVATVTVTLAKGVNFPKTGTATLSANDGVDFFKAIPYTGQSTLIFTGFSLENGATDIVYTLALTLPTSADSKQGVYKVATITTDNPTCA